MKKTPKELRDLVELDLSQLEAIVGGGSAEQNRAGIDSNVTMCVSGSSDTVVADCGGGLDTLTLSRDGFSTITGGMPGRAFTEE